MAEKKSRNSRRKPVQERSRETVDAILEATAQVLLRHGYATCSTNQIAERAGVSIGGLYQYFPNKAAILRQLCIREVKKDADRIEECLKNTPGASIEKTTYTLVKASLERLSDRPKLRQILMYELPSGRPEEDLRLIRKRLAQLLVEKLKSYSQLTADGQMHKEIQILLSATETAIYVAIQEYGEKLDRPKLIGSISDMVLHYLSKYDQTRVTPD